MSHVTRKKCQALLRTHIKQKLTVTKKNIKYENKTNHENNTRPIKPTKNPITTLKPTSNDDVLLVGVGVTGEGTVVGTTDGVTVGVTVGVPAGDIEGVTVGVTVGVTLGC